MWKEFPNVEEGVALILRVEMGARTFDVEFRLLAARNRLVIAVKLKPFVPGRIGEPRRQQPNEGADRKRRESAIRPDDLGNASGGTIGALFLVEAVLGQEAHASHARIAGKRRNHLACNGKLPISEFGHVHADVDVGC
jgi:hypothetical protein